MYSKKFINNGFLHIKNNKTFVDQCVNLDKLIKRYNEVIKKNKIFNKDLNQEIWITSHH